MGLASGEKATRPIGGAQGGLIRGQLQSRDITGCLGRCFEAQPLV